MMYADVVMEKAEGREPARGKGIRKLMDEKLNELKAKKGVKLDTELTAEDLKGLVAVFKGMVKTDMGVSFPETPLEQLWGGIGAVFMCLERQTRDRISPY